MVVDIFIMILYRAYAMSDDSPFLTKRKLTGKAFLFHRLQPQNSVYWPCLSCKHTYIHALVGKAGWEMAAWGEVDLLNYIKWLHNNRKLPNILTIQKKCQNITIHTIKISRKRISATRMQKKAAW